MLLHFEIHAVFSMDNTKKIKLQVSEAGVIALLHECCDELKVTNGCDHACIFMLLG